MDSRQRSGSQRRRHRRGRSALTDEMRQHIVTATPIGRLARPDEVASTVVWLASPASSYVVGEVIHLDGGAQAVTFPMAIPDIT